MANFTKKQREELSELLMYAEYGKFVDKVEEFTGDVNLGYDLLDEYYEMLDRT